MVGPKRLWGKKKRFALIGVAVAVLVLVGWLLWPEPTPKELTLYMQIVRSEVVNGKTNFLFRVEGAGKCPILINRIWYVDVYENSLPDPDILDDHVHREFCTGPPVHPPDRGWKVRANAYVLRRNNVVSTLYWVTRDTWRLHSGGATQSVLSLAKTMWRGHSMTAINDEVITSELITNTPPH